MNQNSYACAMIIHGRADVFQGSHGVMLAHPGVKCQQGKDELPKWLSSGHSAAFSYVCPGTIRQSGPEKMRLKDARDPL